MRGAYNRTVERAVQPASRGVLMHLACAAILALMLAACTPQQALVSALVPEGTVSVLLSHLQGAPEGNRKRVVDLETRKDWDGLAKLADENLVLDRNSADWWFVAGYAHSQAGRQERAIQCYNEVVRLAPDDTLGWNQLAISYRETRQPLRAVQALNQSHLVRKGTPETYFMLGESYSELDRYLPAAAAYREALQMNSELAPAWFGLGRAYARLHRSSDFDHALKELARLDPQRAQVLAEMRPGPR